MLEGCSLSAKLPQIILITMHVYRSLVPPTVVTHSLACKLTGTDNLVVVKGGSLLQIYKFVSVKTQLFDESTETEGNEVTLGDKGESFLDTEIALTAVRVENNTKLVLEGEWPLEGQVTGIEAVRTLVNPDVDSLLISFRLAKMVIVTWNPELLDINCLSLHYYEKGIFESPYFDKTFTSTLRVDPHSACACLSIQKDSLVFLPFLENDILEQPGAVDTSGTSKTAIPPFYSPSYFMNARELSSDIANITDFCFLHEYREPTIAIIYEPTRTWTGLFPLHKDTINYQVLSLDPQHRTTTSIVLVNNLPYDIRKIIPVKKPIGGALLVGVNVIIHIDSQGRKHEVAVNEYCTLTTENNFTDQKSLGISLENCEITSVPGVDSEMILVTVKGELFIVKFTVESRRVQEFSLTPVSSKSNLKLSNPSCITALESTGKPLIFVGSETDQSRVIERVRVKSAELNEQQKFNSTMDDDLDDIYGYDESLTSKEGGGAYSIDYRVHDTLVSYGPVQNILVNKSGKIVTNKASFSSKVQPVIISELELEDPYTKIWTVNPSGVGIAGDNDDTENAVFDTFLVASSRNRTDIYRIDSEFFLITPDIKKFYDNMATVQVQTLSEGHTVIVQRTRISLYDSSWVRLAKLVFSSDIYVHSAYFCDKTITINFSDSTTAYCQIKENNGNWSITLEKSQTGVSFLAQSFQLSCIAPNSDKKRSKRSRDDEIIYPENSSSSSVGVKVLLKNDSEEILFSFLNQPTQYDFSVLGHLPSAMRLENSKFEIFGNKDISGKEPRIISNIQLFQISNSTEKIEYFAVKTADNFITFYRINVINNTLYLLKARLTTSLSFLVNEDSEFPTELIPFSNVNGYSGLFITGTTPLIVLKDPHGPCIIHKLANEYPIRHFSTFNTPSVYKGFAFLDIDSLFQIARLPEDTDLSIPWSANRLPFESSVSSLCYHESSDVFVASTMEETEYHAVDEDDQPISGVVNKSYTYKSSLKLISPQSFHVIDSLELENETIVTMKTMYLQVSQKTNRRKEFLVFGTTTMKGEDLAVKGGFYIYEIIDIVPEPGKPETNRKLKLIASESGKGAVTSICEVNGDLLIAQAQKVCYSFIISEAQWNSFSNLFY